MKDLEKKIINMFEIIDGADNTDWKKLKEWSFENEAKARIVIGWIERNCEIKNKK